MAVAHERPQGWVVMASLRDVADASLARLWIVPAAAAVATGVLLTVGAGFGGVRWLADTGSAAPAGLDSPLASIVAALAGRLAVAAHVLAAFCACFGLLRIVVRLAGSKFGGMTVTTLLVGLAGIVAGPGLISGAAIIAGAFSPIQAAAALLILALALSLDDRPVAGVALLGVVFAIQPEVALWGVVFLAGASVGLRRNGARMSRAWLVGGGSTLLFAVPAALWWVHAGTFLPAPASMDGLLPLPPWQPWSVPMGNWVLCACMLAMGLAALCSLGPDGRGALGAFMAALPILVGGCVMPLVTKSPWLLALRPMAIDAVLQPLATVAVAAVLARDLARHGGMLRLALSVIAAVSLLLHPFLLPLAALAMLARAAAANGELLGIERRIRDWDRMLLSRATLSAIGLAAVAGGVLQHW